MVRTPLLSAAAVPNQHEIAAASPKRAPKTHQRFEATLKERKSIFDQSGLRMRRTCTANTQSDRNYSRADDHSVEEKEPAHAQADLEEDNANNGHDKRPQSNPDAGNVDDLL
jgi:hypothetical protein